MEFGSSHSEPLLFLHGGGLSWWNYREAAGLLAPDYHVLVPVLDGHAGSDRPFTSIEDNAAEILSWIDTHLGGHVLLIGGLSLGAQVLLSLLSMRGDVCRHALVESASVIPSALTHALIGPAVSWSYPLIRSSWFARLQFRSLHMKPDLFEDYYRDSCAIRKSDMVAFMRSSTAFSLPSALRSTSASVHIYAGKKETREILFSARQIHQLLPESTETILPGLYHGEFSMSHADAYASAVRTILKEI